MTENTNITTNNTSFLKFLTFATVRVWIAFLIVFMIVGAIVSVMYSTTDDFPKCTHRQMIENAVIKKNPNAVVAPTTNCITAGHSPDPLDISSLKTGDVLTISYRGARSLFSASTFRSNWTHTGMIWMHEKTGEPYVLEAATYRPPYIGHVIRLPLLHWIRINRNVRAVALSRITPEAPNDKISKAFAYFEKSDVGVESLRPDWFRFTKTKEEKDLPATSFFADPSRRQKPRTRSETGFSPFKYVAQKAGIWDPPRNGSFEYVLTCHEILIHVLQLAQIVDMTPTACSYMPNAFVKQSVAMKNGYKYEEPEAVDITPLFEIGKF
jgi:hypothetical protein